MQPLNIGITARINKRKFLASVSRPPFGMGFWKEGNTLIIGEQSAKPPLHPIGQDPFCGMKGCSRWLNEWLDYYNVNEEKLFWINALNLDNTKADVAKIVKLLKPLKIIALGNIASKLCEENEIPHLKIPHPAWWRRFRSKEIYPLLEHVL